MGTVDICEGHPVCIGAADCRDETRPGAESNVLSWNASLLWSLALPSPSPSAPGHRDDAMHTPRRVAWVAWQIGTCGGKCNAIRSRPGPSVGEWWHSRKGRGGGLGGDVLFIPSRACVPVRTMRPRRSAAEQHLERSEPEFMAGNRGQHVGLPSRKTASIAASG